MQGTRQAARQATRGGIMSRIPRVMLAAALTVATSAVANAAEPIALRDMGSFHVGGRLVEISGKPVKEITFAPGGVPAKIDPNGTKQNVPRWTTNDDATLAAYIAEIDRVCPCVILFHSQAGTFGFKAAQARPDKVKALVAVEPAGIGDPARIDALKGIPSLLIYGDFIERDSRWPKIRATGIAFADGIKAAGGSADVVDLPKAGISGNSHMMMMDKNNTEVAALIQTWLQGKGLTKKP